MKVLAYVHLRNIHNSTGAGRVARLLTEHLAARPDVQVKVLADRKDHDEILPKVGSPWTEYEYSLFADDTTRQQWRWYLTDRPRAESYWSSADITYCTAESYVPTRSSRLVVTMHDAAYFEAGAQPRSVATLKQRAKWQLLFGRIARRADMIHTVSQFSADRLAHFFPALRGRFQVVPNAVTPRFFGGVSAEGEHFVRELGLDRQPFILLPSGLNYRKNAELVLRAWPILQARHPGVRLVVSRHNDPHYATAAQALGPSVLLLGYVSDEALRSLYGRAAAVWVPSLYEGFGIPVIEAMACGTPVVASDCTSLPEVAGTAAILVPPHAPGDHADALAAMLDDSTSRAELVARGRARAAEFTWERSAAALRLAFNALL